jgi:S-adenosylmethionine:tRNA ribosyltransferase-isomerase
MELQPEHIAIKNYTYDLPAERIAYFPLPERDASKLLVYKEGVASHRQFSELAELLPGGAMLVLNDTRVIEARIFFQKSTGGIIEVFCLEPHVQTTEAALGAQDKSTWKCLIGGASKWKPGQVLSKELRVRETFSTLTAKYLGKEDDSFIIEFEWEPGTFHFAEILHAAGAIPLPPYIKRIAEDIDQERYQTVFNKYEGSVAAPTAALHFTEATFKSLKEKGIGKEFITLHVGAGTFKPVKTDTIAEHQMHGESFHVSKKTIENLLKADKIISVGTTTVRTLESLHWLGVKLHQQKQLDEWELQQWECYQLEQELTYQDSFSVLLTWMEKNQQEDLHCRTSLIIIPGYSFKVSSALITNFHQPQSTLLLLVAAFVGEEWKEIYQTALQKDYRFLSYGDSSLLWR